MLRGDGSRECQSKSPAAESSDCLRDLGFSGLGLAAVWLSSACHRSTNPNQNALSLALRAAAARRRHSSARRRNCSTLTSRPSPDRPTAPFSGRKIQQLYRIFGSILIKIFARTEPTALHRRSAHRAPMSAHPYCDATHGYRGKTVPALRGGPRALRPLAAVGATLKGRPYIRAASGPQGLPQGPFYINPCCQEAGSPQPENIRGKQGVAAPSVRFATLGQIRSAATSRPQRWGVSSSAGWGGSGLDSSGRMGLGVGATPLTSVLRHFPL